MGKIRIQKYVYSKALNRRPILDLRSPTVLIFRIGQLGDTLVAMPAIDLIRKKFPNHRMVLLTNIHPGKTKYMASEDILGPTRWFDQIVYYNAEATGWNRLKMLCSLILKLRTIRTEHFYNLSPECYGWRRLRDEWFFKIAVRPRSNHTSAIYWRPSGKCGDRLPRLKPEWRRLLDITGDEVTGDFPFRLPISKNIREKAFQIAFTEGIDCNAKLVAVCPGSKMPAKRWPVESFAELGKRLIKDFPDLCLVIFGDTMDAIVGDKLCLAWGGRAYNLAGKLPVYGSAAILEKCVAYVGNDTGTMHLAAMVGTPCVAIFSSRDHPGIWEPYGKGHIVLRRDVACSGCMLQVCEQQANKCLKLISVDDVYAATRNLIEQAKAPVMAKEEIGNLEAF